MLKRLKELDDKAEECKQEAKRIREDNEITDILNRDLAEWKSKLQDAHVITLQERIWKLFFFLKDRQPNPFQNYDPVFERPFSIQTKRPWLFQEYKTEFSAENPIFIAAASRPDLLIPATAMAHMRLQSFGFAFVVCPMDLELPKTTLAIACDFPSIIFGLQPAFTWPLHPDELEKSYPIGDKWGEASLTNPDYVTLVHHEIELMYEVSTGRANKKIDGILAEMDKLDEARANLKKELDRHRSLATTRLFLNSCLK